MQKGRQNHRVDVGPRPSGSKNRTFKFPALDVVTLENFHNLFLKNGAISLSRCLQYTSLAHAARGKHQVLTRLMRSECKHHRPMSCWRMKTKFLQCGI